MSFAGIDVSYKTFVLVLRQKGKPGKPSTFDNTASGHQKVIEKLRQGKVQRMCLEATGQYHLDLALALVDAGLELAVLNPKVAKRFAEALGSRSKTDAVDAAVLAEYAERMPYEPWQRPSNAALGLRACARRLSALSAHRTELKNQRHAAGLTQATPAFLLEELQQSLAYVDTQIASLRGHAVTLIEADETLNVDFTLLLSIKGVAQASAIQILGELAVLPAPMKAKQWVAMAGLDPRHHESGDSVQKKPRLSKAGNRYLRLALFMPALCASRFDPNVRAYYLHLIEHRGLKKIQAVCAVMRKLLHAIHGMFHSRTPFDSGRFYLPQHNAA